MAQPKRKRPVRGDSTRVNNSITAPVLRVVDAEGKQLGIIDRSEALELAANAGLDLVEVSAKSDPPVCRIMDYGKFKYQQSKKQHDARKKQVIIRIKEIKLRPKTEEHDFRFKLKNARGFLESGNKVKVTVQYRGREMAFTQMGIELLRKFAREVEDVGIVETTPRGEGRTTLMILAPKKTEKG
ncbi:MAG: translation initiation factor IF-3 [Proteobacteria bacterium]|nr:translation initiation factor IF-3 [Pseudomonadota bacterium]